MKTDTLETDLFLEAEEAIRGLMAIEHRDRIRMTKSDLTSENAKLEYLQKLVSCAGLQVQCDQNLSAVLLEKMDGEPFTEMTLDDYAMAVLRAVSGELNALPGKTR